MMMVNYHIIEYHCIVQFTLPTSALTTPALIIHLLVQWLWTVLKDLHVVQMELVRVQPVQVQIVAQ